MPAAPILITLAERFERSSAGRHGGGKVDYLEDLEELLQAAGCREGSARELAERALRQAAAAGLLVLEPRHWREPETIGTVRLPLAQEAAFYQFLERASPTAQRTAWATLFHEAAAWPVPPRWAPAWLAFCAARATAAGAWRGMKPFAYEDPQGGRELLALLPALLAWAGRHQVRWVSSVLCGHSKTLERRQKTLEGLLHEATAGEIANLADLGILPVPPGVTFHGPLRLRIGAEWRDFRDLHGPATLSGADVERITAVECSATRCLTVENATPFRALAALQSQTVLLHTSYANAATIALLRHLASVTSPLEFWHFGDTDPNGFDILADLRQRTGLPIQAFLMAYRPAPSGPRLTPREASLLGELRPRMPAERPALEAMLHAGHKGDFEQESLRPPTHPEWPFYHAAPTVPGS